MPGHVFISYVHEDATVVERLAADLADLGVEVWLDRQRLEPGVRWRDTIRDAIRAGDLFVACFSRNFEGRDRSHMHEELTHAIDELRSRPTNRAWFIPVVLDDASVPSRSISASETLRDLQWVSLHDDWHRGVNGIAKLAIRHGKMAPVADPPQSPEQHPRAGEDLEARVSRIDRERMAKEEVDRLNFSEAGVHAALAERDSLYSAIAAAAQRVAVRSRSLRVEIERSDVTIVVRAAGHSVLVSWTHKYTNSLMESALYVLEYQRSYFLSSGINLDNPRELKRTRYDFTIQDGAYGWTTGKSFLTTQDLALHCIDILLAYAESRHSQSPPPNSR